MKRLFSILVILSLMASLIAACGGDEAEPTAVPMH
jgi:predicted small lipoprotein YifL